MINKTPKKYKMRIKKSFPFKNYLIDESVMASLTGAEFKCFLFIYRKTIGWQKEADVISNSQFSLHTGLSRQSVVAAVRTLEELGLIICAKSKRNMTKYQIDDGYLLLLTRVNKQKGKKLSPKEVRNLLLHRKKVALTEQIIYLTKDTLLKDNYTKDELLNLFYEKIPPFEKILLEQAGIELTKTVLVWMIAKPELLTSDYLKQLQLEAIATNQTIDSLLSPKIISQQSSENQLGNNINTESNAL